MRVPGGGAANGMELKIWGAPTFSEGERALLFLGRHADGSYRILHLVLGAFREARMAGHAVAYRDLSEVDVLDGAEAQASETRKVRDFDRFADWIADRAANRLEVPNYYLSPCPRTAPEPAAADVHSAGLTTAATRAGSSSTPAAGTSTWRIDPDPLAGFSGSPSDAFRNALGAWNAESHTPIKYNLAGTSGLVAGFDHFDSQNVLLFDDPNDDVEGNFSCSSGGTLAIGGPWFDPNTTGRWNNETFIRIQGADIVFNNGIGFFQNSSNPTKAVEELMGTKPAALSDSAIRARIPDQTLRDAT